jgi:8-oxo-dGTP diphosphatase
VLPGSAGGVVFDKLGRLILREPKGHFGHYVWTYGKGQVQSGESHERTALREVLEETGAKAEIVDCIGDFPGDTGVTRFFLMRLVHDTGVFEATETKSVRWVTPQEAKPLIAQTTSPTGRERDLAVLAAATELWQKHANR